MDAIEIKEWLDKLIENIENFNSLRNFNSQIYTLPHDRTIMIYNGIEIIADMLETSLICEDSGGDFFNFKYYINYKGYEIIQFSKERLDAVSD